MRGDGPLGGVGTGATQDPPTLKQVLLLAEAGNVAEAAELCCKNPAVIPRLREELLASTNLRMPHLCGLPDGLAAAVHSQCPDPQGYPLQAKRFVCAAVTDGGDSTQAQTVLKGALAKLKATEKWLDGVAAACPAFKDFIEYSIITFLPPGGRKSYGLGIKKLSRPDEAAQAAALGRAAKLRGVLQAAAALKEERAAAAAEAEQAEAAAAGQQATAAAEAEQAGAAAEAEQAMAPAASHQTLAAEAGQSAGTKVQQEAEQAGGATAQQEAEQAAGAKKGTRRALGDLKPTGRGKRPGRLCTAAPLESKRAQASLAQPACTAAPSLVTPAQGPGAQVQGHRLR